MRRWAVVLVLATAAVLGGGSGVAVARCRFSVCGTPDGTVTHLGDSDVRNLPGAPAGGPTSGDRYEYHFEIACAGAAAGASCRGALLACIGIGPGPLHDVARRVVHDDGRAEAWVRVGDTCFPPASAAPQLTYAMILEAFHLTPWAKGSISTQPKGDVTLVGLKTYFRVSWSSDGFEPGEVDAVDPARMLGHRVDIRPRVVGVVYRFGDGASEGPTTDLGGIYPTGRVTHSYSKAGVYPTHVEVIWSADFRVDGGAWTPIPQEVTVTGPDTPVTVKTARAVLVG